ncbi:MAG TPA: ATP-binding protein [Actinomycetota bacterium]|nr:ATP-binding protein [Actinomycetota bacterium]
MKRPRLLAAYIGAVALSGALLWARAAFDGFPVSPFRSIEFWLLAAAVLGGEFVRIKVQHGNEVSIVTVGDPFTLTLLFMFGIGPALLLKTIASIVEDLSRRQPWWKLLFNASQVAVALTLTHLVFRFLSGNGADAIGIKGEIGASFVAACTFFVVNLGVVHTAIALALGSSPIKAIRNNLRSRAINQGLLLGSTPVLLAALERSTWLFPLLLIPIVIVYQAGVMAQRHMILATQLRELYEATRITQGSAKSQHSIRMLLERVCDMFNAEQATIILFPRSTTELATRTTLDVATGRFLYGEPIELDPTHGIWARVASEDHPVMLASPIENERLAEYFGVRGIKDLMAAPLRSDDGVAGVLEVSNRTGISKTFETEDLKLFETLTNHASIALENARLINELEESLAHLTEMNRLKDDFVASVSHELRTPLTSIRGYVKTLLRHEAHFGPEETRAFLETIDRQSQRLHRLIEDLLVVSRIESPSSDEDVIHEIPLRQLIDDVVDELRSRLSDRVVTIALDDGVPVVRTDVGKLHQIIGNLIDNAVKYSPAGSPIDIEVKAQDAGITISIRDSGPGIDENAHEKIFDRFYQVYQTATRKFGGAGLGLYICRKLAEALGGRLWLERSDGSGSEFSLWIPPEAGAARPSLDLATNV